MKNKEAMTATISTCIGLFDFLKEKVGERKTRTEAYCDLLDKSLAGFVSPFLRNQDFELRPRQCHVTVSDLATEWRWHRATVRSFLDTLESFGQLERTKLPKSMVITMHLHDGSHAVPDIVQGTAGIVRQLKASLPMTPVLRVVRLYTSPSPMPDSSMNCRKTTAVSPCRSCRRE